MPRLSSAQWLRRRAHRRRASKLFVLTGAPGSGKTPIIHELVGLGFTGVAELFDLDPSGAEAAAATHRYNETVFFCPFWPEIYTTDEDRTDDVR